MRKIHCHRCTRYLGEIRDAKLRVGIAHICSNCIANDERPRRVPTGSEAVNDLLHMLNKGKSR